MAPKASQRGLGSSPEVNFHQFSLVWEARWREGRRQLDASLVLLVASVGQKVARAAAEEQADNPTETKPCIPPGRARGLVLVISSLTAILIGVNGIALFYDPRIGPQTEGRLGNEVRRGRRAAAGGRFP